jgi:hypothetical protein
MNDSSWSRVWQLLFFHFSYLRHSYRGRHEQ